MVRNLCSGDTFWKHSFNGLKKHANPDPSLEFFTASVIVNLYFTYSSHAPSIHLMVDGLMSRQY